MKLPLDAAFRSSSCPAACSLLKTSRARIRLLVKCHTLSLISVSDVSVTVSHCGCAAAGGGCAARCFKACASASPVLPYVTLHSFPCAETIVRVTSRMMQCDRLWRRSSAHLRWTTTKKSKSNWRIYPPPPLTFASCS